VLPPSDIKRPSSEVSGFIHAGCIAAFRWFGLALLARLGVAIDHEGRGIGAGLLGDAITRLLSISDEIGSRGQLIHAETAEARDFYLHVIPELEPSPTDELHWCS
jgi:hypothetical protein